ncbi:EF Tu GTP binding domain-containing protein [Trametes versicolor FP-101664 SS1]|uniref:EF Tu GTP binding domain-containing protein n=1 Tax=Trametes versicolor (strain FP-101664) TaxID=717944 RepID=UPI0004621866|nr:EF Tu GTP binding domain-containing protein [Trametes versicolor FP-101664 SS1]EIW61774.1 EF Tu GTP binding domain-containing protein [Trametes versicolor FP-101664 SS1]
MNQSEIDMAGLNLYDEEAVGLIPDEPAKPPAAIEKLIEEAKTALTAQEQGDKRSLSLVVIGHVDAGKSTLMGRLLYELGRVDEKKRIANERGSSKMGKSSFSWAWELDGTQEERERGITMDIALQTLVTPHRVITILDAPGHKDFIPNMISGASQADSALMVVDAAVGEFEAGFERGGQTREHLLLVRSLGVSQVIVAVNKLDQVEWSKARYEEICELMRPFLLQSGFHPNKTRFVPVAAMEGINLAQAAPKGSPLNQWYKGPTLVNLLDTLDPPTRDINAPLRFPISNVFKGQTSGISVSGRVCGGIIVAGERLRIVPGDESATVRAIDSDGDGLPWAGAGSNVNLTLTGVDPISLNIGSVLCRPSHVVPLSSTFTARIIVFDIQMPITAGASVELFHHSRDVPASISRLISVLDRANGSIVKNKPRVLTKNMSAEVEITLRGSTYSGPASRALPIPIEAFSANKEMGRILVRRGGETIGAGVVTELLA